MSPQTQLTDAAVRADAVTTDVASGLDANSDPSSSGLAGKHVGMVVFSPYPADPRPRRAAETLLSQGMTIDLICEGAPGFPRFERRGGLEITRIPIQHERGGVLSYAYQYSLFIFTSAFLFAWRMLRRRYDLIYIHNMPDVLIISALVPKIFGAKVILDLHDPMPELMMTIFERSEDSFPVRVIKRLEKWSIGRANFVITVNEACRKIFSQRSCSAGKVGVVMNSPDEKIFNFRSARSYPQRTADQPFVIMYHGSLVERNGLELAVQALSLIHKKVPNAELRIYGANSPYLKKVMNLIESLGLQDHARFLGVRKLEELVHEIEGCDIGVIPNQRNIFTEINTPTRIFEYLALGKPVIAPSTPGITDYFGSDSLTFFESGDAADLAARLEYAAAHPLEMTETADRGQQVYLAHRWQQERNTLVTLVSDLMVKGKLRGSLGQ